MTSPHYTLLLAQQNTKEPFFCIDFKKIKVKFYSEQKSCNFFKKSL